MTETKMILLYPLQTLITVFGNMLNCVGAAGKVFEYLDRQPEVSTKGTLEPETLKGQICFQKVTFSYPTRSDHSVLKVQQLPDQLTGFTFEITQKILLSVYLNAAHTL